MNRKFFNAICRKKDDLTTARTEEAMKRDERRETRDENALHARDGRRAAGQRGRWIAAVALAAGMLLGGVQDAWALYARGGFNSWGGWAMSQNGNFWESPVNNTATATSSDGMKFDNNNNWGVSWGAGTAATKNSTIGTATKNGNNNLSLSVTSGKYYYFRVAGTDDWTDRSYAVFETTSQPLRTISSQSQSGFTWSSSKYNITITATLSGTIATEQKVYIRYTTDDWATSSYGTMTKSGATATYTFSDATANKTYKYYILTTTFETSKLTSDTIYSSPNNTTAYDFLVYSALNDNGNNYSFTTPNWSSPTVTTMTTLTARGTTTATVQGKVTANGGVTLTANGSGIQYGTTTSYGSTAAYSGTPTVGTAYPGSLSSLTPAQQYHFRAYSANSMGTGYGSDATFYTLPNAPTLTAGTLTASSVAFTIAANNNASATYAYKNGSSGTLSSYGAAGSKTINSLNAGTTYTVYAYAKNGGGDVSDAATISLTTKPNAPTVTAGSTTASSISFTPGANQNGAATSYKYYVGTSSSGTPTDSCTAGTAVTVSSLQPNTTYYVIVRATAGGNTADSTATAITTASPAAGQVVNWLSTAASGEWENATTFPWHYVTAAVDWKNVTDFGAQHVKIDNDIQPAQTIAANTTVASLTYGSGATTAHTLSGSSTLTVNGGITNAASATHTISTPVALGANTEVNVSGASGGVTIGGAVSGAYTLTKKGSGKLTLSGANTYSGATTVSAGTLAITTTNALGTTTGGTTVASGATLAIAPAAAFTNSEPLTLSGGTVSNVNYANHLTGPITLSADSKFDTGANTALYVDAPISGSGGLEQIGTAKYLYLRGTNTYTGTTTVTGYRIYISDNGTTNASIAGNLSIASGKYAYVAKNSGLTWTYDKIISGAGHIYKGGAGTWVLSGANTFSGTCFIDRGSLVVSNSSALGTSTVRFYTGKYVKTLRFATDLTTTKGLTFNTPEGYTATISVDAGKTATFNGAFTGTSNGVLAKAGSGTLVMGGVSTFTAPTTVLAGTLKLTGTAASSAFTVSDGTLEAGSASRTVASLTMTNGALSVGTDKTFSSSTGAAELTGGRVNFDASGWTKSGTTQSWTIFAGGAAATCSDDVNLVVTLATGTTASEYSIAASGNDIVVTWQMTQSAPAVANNTITAIGTTSATLGATVTADGNATISTYGVKVGTSADPTSGGYSQSGAPTIGTAFSQAVSGLAANTLYYVRGFATNTKGTGYATNSSFRTTAATRTAPTASSFSSRTNTQFRVRWTDQNYTNVLIVMGTSDPTTAPTARTTYEAANGTLANAPEIATGQKIVYKGSGTEATTYRYQLIKGLTAGTHYYVRIYGYDGVEDTDPLLNSMSYSAAATTNGYTLSAEPTAQAGLTLNTRTANSISLNVTRATDATHTLVVAYSNSTSYTAPSDGTTNAASATYGSGAALGTGNGYVVYSGTDASTTLTVNGLTEGTRYCFVAYSYNRTSASKTTANYLTTSPASVDTYTLATAPVSAATVTYNAHTADSLTWKYTRDSSDTAGVVIVMKAGGTPTWTPTAGAALPSASDTFGNGAGSADAGYVVYAGTGGTASGGASLLVSGLDAGTQYYAVAYPYKGSATGTTYNYGAASTATNGWTLAAEPAAAPTTFTATRDSSSPESKINLSWSQVTGATGYLIFRRTGSEYSAIPSGVPSDGTAPATSGELIGIVTSGSTTTYADSGLSAATTYYYAIVPFANGSDNTTYNYATAYAAANATTFATTPGTPSALTFSGKTSTNVTISWTAPATAPAGYLVVIGTGTLSEPANGTTYTADPVYTNGTTQLGGKVVKFSAGTSVNVTGLTSGTTYTVRVYAYNGGSGTAAYGTMLSGTVKTLTAAPTTFTVTADGPSLVRMTASGKASGDSGYLIVYKAGSAPAALVQGTTYNLGSSVTGGGKVIYKSTTAPNSVDFIADSGTTGYYAVYGYNGTAYSIVKSATASMSSYRDNMVVENFSFTNATAITTANWNGEKGWSGGWDAWDNSSSYIKMAKPAIDSSQGLVSSVHLPQSGGNAVWFNGSNDTRVVRMARGFNSAYTSGKMWFMFTVRTEYGCTNASKPGEAANKHFGMQFMSTANDSTTAFAAIGAPKGYWAKLLGIDTSRDSSNLPNGSSVTSGAYEIKDYGHSSSAAHTIYGYVDIDNNVIKANATYSGADFTASSWTGTVPSTWDVSKDVTVSGVAGIALYSYGYCGNTYFDELRFADTWSKLIGATLGNPAAPTAFTATADGNEMIRTSVTVPSGVPKILVVTNSTATFTDPTDGTSYAVGASLGTGKVVYVGEPGGFTELVVPAGSNPYLKVWSYNDENYSTSGLAPTPASIPMGTYENDIIVDTFSYTNMTQPSAAWVGGQGWGNHYWAKVGDTARIIYSIQTNSLTASAAWIGVAPSNYMAPAGNALQIIATNNNSTGAVQRTFANSIGGASGEKMYVAFLMGYQYEGAQKWAGLNLMNNDTEKAFFGKAYSPSYYKTLGIGVGSNVGWANKSLEPLQSGLGNIYLIVGKVEWTASDTANLYVKAYDAFSTSDCLPQNEVTAWDAEYLNASIGAITGVKFNAGCDASSAAIGCAYFDALRITTNWDTLVESVAPTEVAMCSTTTTNCYLGDTIQVKFKSKPIGVGQKARFAVSYDSASTWVNDVSAGWVNNDATYSYWTNPPIRMTNTATGTASSPYVRTKATVSGGGTTLSTTGGTPYINVQALPNPTVGTLQPGQQVVTCNWTKATASSRTWDTMIVRYPANNSTVTHPTQGVTYNAGDTLGLGTVIYRGNGTTFVDSGLSYAATTYKYYFYAENYSYYSSGATSNATTVAATEKMPTINGSADDWFGTPSPVKNSSVCSLNEFIWTDKTGDERVDDNDHQNADLTEWRVKADQDYVYMLFKLTNIDDINKVHIAVGIDTRQSTTSSAMSWLGDDSGVTIGDGYFGSSAAEHYPERQLAVHYVSGAWKVEMFAADGTKWYAPITVPNVTTGAWQAVGSTSANCVEICVNRADLNLSGAVTGRFTVATFLNTVNTWNNDGTATRQIGDASSPHAVDSVSIVPYNTQDRDCQLSAWDEDIKDADIDFWVDIPFSAAKMSGNTAPATPTGCTPADDASGFASPTLSWTASSDTDGAVTGYFLEVSTNENFGATSGSENGTVVYRVNLPAGTTSYKITTSTNEYWWRVRARDTSGALSGCSIQRYHVAGKLDNDGPQATLLYVGPKLADYRANTDGYKTHQDNYSLNTSVLDSECGSGNSFGFMIQWEDPSGVYATNKARARVENWYNHTDKAYPGTVTKAGITYTMSAAGDFAYNIVSDQGRVSPNWDLIAVNTSETEGVTAPAAISIVDASGNTVTTNWTWKTNSLYGVDYPGWTIEWGFDQPFTLDQTDATGNGATCITNFVANAFQLPAYNPAIEFYLTVSAEDNCTHDENGNEVGWSSWPPANSYGIENDNGRVWSENFGSWSDDYSDRTSSGFCADGPNPMRNVTTNQLIPIHVIDNDNTPPVFSSAKWGTQSVTPVGGSSMSITPGLVVATNTGSVGTWSAMAGKLDISADGGTSQDILYQIYDGDLYHSPLSFYFNVYDQFDESGLQYGTTETSTVGGYTMTNTSFVAAGWTTNWANFDQGKSSITRNASTDAMGSKNDTVLTWQWANVDSAVVSALWGPVDEGLLDNAYGVTNFIQLDAWDADKNRAGDQAHALIAFGSVRLIDDDRTAPTISSFSPTGSGTNSVEFGQIAKWSLTSDETLTTRINTSYVAGSSVTASDNNLKRGNNASKVGSYLQSGMDKDTYSASKYIAFDVWATNGAEWRSQSLTFEAYSTGEGPTNFTLTVQSGTGTETVLATETLQHEYNDAGVLIVQSATLVLPFTSELTGANEVVHHFKLYAWGAPSSGNAYFKDVTLQGALSAPRGTAITDKDLRFGTWTNTMSAADGEKASTDKVKSGLWLQNYTSTANGDNINESQHPKFEILNSAGTTSLTNGYYTIASAPANGTATITDQKMQPGAFDVLNSSLFPVATAGTEYTLKATIADFDVDRTNDWRTASTNQSFTVYDDDKQAPQPAWTYGGPFGIKIANTPLASANSKGSGYDRTHILSDHLIADNWGTGGNTAVSLHLGFYDYSGWKVTNFSFGGTTIWDGDAAQGSSIFQNTTSQGAADSTVAEAVWTTTMSQLWSTYGGASRLGTEQVVNAGVTDLDADRVDASGNNIDNLSLATRKVGTLTLIDQDDKAPRWRSTENAIVLTTNATTADAMTNDTCRLHLESGTSGQTNATYVLYDSQLRRKGNGSIASFAVTADVVDPPGTSTGQHSTGLQRGKLQSFTTNTVLSGNVTMSNTHMRVLNGGTTKLTATNWYDAGNSTDDSTTKMSASPTRTVWRTTSPTYSTAEAFLPRGASTAENKIWIYAYDADCDRDGDQMEAKLEGPTLKVYDNDTNAPAEIDQSKLTVNGNTVSTTITRDNAPWTNNPTNVVRFAPVADGTPTGTLWSGPDFEATGIGEYRVVEKPSVTLTVFNDRAPTNRAYHTNGYSRAVATADGMLGDPGFENYGLSAGKTSVWTHVSGATNAINSGAYVTEGMYSVRLNKGTTIKQIVPLLGADASGDYTFTLSFDARVQSKNFATNITFGFGSFSQDESDCSSEGTVTQALTAAMAHYTIENVQQHGIVMTEKYLKFTITNPNQHANATNRVYVDNVRLTYTGTQPQTVPMIFVATNQGMSTNFLFAVDADFDRRYDQSAGKAAQFCLAYDATPPTSLAEAGSSWTSRTNVLEASSEGLDTYTVSDPTSEMAVRWTKSSVTMQPDRTTASPTSGTDTYAPWKSYKLYALPYEVGTTDGTASFSDSKVASAIANFDGRSVAERGATNGTYVWQTISSDDGDDYSSLAASTTKGFTAKGLEPGENYIFAVVGVDKAGNESEYPVYALGDTIKFAVTQGVYRAWGTVSNELNTSALGTSIFSPSNHAGLRGTPTLYWEAKLNNTTHRTGRGYSLVYRDGTAFEEGASLTTTDPAGNTVSGWGRIAGNSISNNFYAEPDGNAQKLGRGRMRFYRATYAGREFATNNVVPLASEEVYALHNVKLSEGRNYVSLHGVPYTNTFRGVFGADTTVWPAAATKGGATQVEFYDANGTTNAFWLDNNGVWRNSNNADVTDTEQADNFFTRGFAIVLPPRSSFQNLYTDETVQIVEAKSGGGTYSTNVYLFNWAPILQMPTNDVDHKFSVTVNCGTHSTKQIGRITKIIYDGVDTLGAFRAPVALHPSELGLTMVSGTATTTGGFVYNASAPFTGDRLLIWAAAAKDARARGDETEAGVAGHESLSAVTQMYYDGEKWRWLSDITSPSANPEVTGKPIKPNDAIVIRSFNGGKGNSWTWEYTPTNLYPAADRHFGH